VKIARISPGVFLILVAAILIGVCATHSVSFTSERSVSQPSPQSSHLPSIGPTVER
jgi:hypothetical protein